MSKAIVLCGGKGTRLRPYTYSIPKPMLPLGRKPILEYVIGNLKRGGFTELYLTVGYLQERIMDYFGDGKKFGVNIKYYSEGNKCLNTAGSIIPIKEEIDDNFLVVMGDHLTNVDLKKIFDFHTKKGCIATIGLKRMGVPLEYGIAHLDKNDFISRFDEKPILENLVNAGIYAFKPEIFDHIRENEDFAMQVFPRLLEKKEKINGFVFDEYWMDIGRTSDYEHVNQLISIFDIMLHK